jgi:hypothetical protein
VPSRPQDGAAAFRRWMTIRLICVHPYGTWIERERKTGDVHQPSMLTTFSPELSRPMHLAGTTERIGPIAAN